MTSPLTMAVALMIEGMAEPNICGFWGRRSECAVSRESASDGASCASAAVPAATDNAAAINHTRAEFRRKAAATIRFSLETSTLCLLIAVYPGPLNAALAAESFQCQMKGKSASLAEGADLLIVAPPRQAKLQTIIFIFDAEPVPHRLIAVRERQRVLALVGEVDDRRPEDGPIAVEQHPPGEPQLFLVAQVLDGGVDVAIEPEVADL